MSNIKNTKEFLKKSIREDPINDFFIALGFPHLAPKFHDVVAEIKNAPNREIILHTIHENGSTYKDIERDLLPIEIWMPNIISDIKRLKELELVEEFGNEDGLKVFKRTYLGKVVHMTLDTQSAFRRVARELKNEKNNDANLAGAAGR